MTDLELQRRLQENFYSSALEEFSCVPSDKKYAQNLLYDLATIPLVKKYYRGGHKEDFNTYIERNTAIVLKSLPYYDFIQNHFNQLHSQLSEVSIFTKVPTGTLRILGDFHFDTLKVSDGSRIYYKNNLHLEELITKIVHLLDLPYFPSYETTSPFVVRPYVNKNSSILDKKEYYYHFGFICGLILYLRGLDFNADNLLISDKKLPLLFDFEFLFSPQTSIDEFNISLTGLIQGDREGGNISALFSGYKDNESLLKPILYIREDKPYIKWRTKSKRGYMNNPYIDSEIIEHPKQYILDLLCGYDHAISCLSSKSASLVDLIKDAAHMNDHQLATRVLIRPTRTYRAMHVSLNYAEGNINSYIAEKVTTYGILDEHLVDRKALIEYETNCFRNLAIPYYHTEINSKDILNHNGAVLGSFAKSPLQQFEEHVKSFSKLAMRERENIQSLVNSYTI